MADKIGKGDEGGWIKHQLRLPRSWLHDDGTPKSCRAFLLTSYNRGADQWLLRVVAIAGPFSLDLTAGRYDWDTEEAIP